MQVNIVVIFSKFLFLILLAFRFVETENNKQ